MIFEKKNILDEKSFKLSRRILYLSLLIAVFFQIVIGTFSFNSVVISIILFVTSVYTFSSILNKKMMEKFFFPSLIILSLNFTLISGPLIFKTLFVQKIDTNLFFPIKVFCLVCAYQLVLIFCLKFYSISSSSLKLSRKINFYLIQKLKVFNVPRVKYSIIILFLFTLNKIYLNFVDQGVGAFTQIGDVRMKILYALEDFFYLPLVFFSINYFINKKISNFLYFLIILYYLVFAVIFGLASNSRQEILSIFFVIFILILIFRIFHLKKFNNLIKLILFSSFLFLFLFMDNLSNSILKSRGIRDVVSAKDLIFLTLPNNQVNIKEEFLVKIPDDETYTNNDVVDRFIFVKFIDKSLYLSNNLTNSQKIEFKNFIQNRLISLFPITFINLFDKNFNKQKYIASNGSLLEKINYGDFKAGLLNTGSFLVELLIITESYLLTGLIIFLANLILFIFLQSFQNNSEKYIQFSPIMFILIFHYLFLPNSDNSSGFIFNSVRRPMQVAILYFILNLFSSNQSINHLNKKN